MNTLQLFNYRNWVKLAYHFKKNGLSSKIFKLSPVNPLKLRSFACNYISLLSLNTKNGSDIRLLYCGDRYASLKKSVSWILPFFVLLNNIYTFHISVTVNNHQNNVTQYSNYASYVSNTFSGDFFLRCVLTDVFNTFVSFSTCKL